MVSSIRTTSPSVYSFFVVRVILFRATDDLPVKRVLHLALDQHGHGLVGLVGGDGPDQDTFGHCLLLTPSLGSGARARSFCSVLILAIVRRTSRMRARRLKLVGRRLKTQVELLALQRRSAQRQLVVGLGAKVFDGQPLLVASQMRGVAHARNNLGLDRQLHRGAFKRERGQRAGTPSSSNKMRPGFTRAAQYSTEPLPLP